MTLLAPPPRTHPACCATPRAVAVLTARLAVCLALAFARPVRGTTRVAASPPLPALTVRVPFDFRAGASRFGPGAYVISLIEEAASDRRAAGGTGASVRIESRDRGSNATIRAQRSPGGGAAPVVSFRVYGDQRFLAFVQTGDAGSSAGDGSRTGRRAWEIPASADERSMGLRWGAPSVLRLKAATFRRPDETGSASPP